MRAARVTEPQVCARSRRSASRETRCSPMPPASLKPSPHTADQAARYDDAAVPAAAGSVELRAEAHVRTGQRRLLTEASDARRSSHHEQRAALRPQRVQLTPAGSTTQRSPALIV